MLDVRSIMYCWKALLFDKTVSLNKSKVNHVVDSCELIVFTIIQRGRGVEIIIISIDMGT